MRFLADENMARVRRTMENIRRLKPRINRAKIDATTEADIRRHMREEDQDETVLAGFAPVIPPRGILAPRRARLAK